MRPLPPGLSMFALKGDGIQVSHCYGGRLQIDWKERLEQETSIIIEVLLILKMDKKTLSICI